MAHYKDFAEMKERLVLECDELFCFDSDYDAVQPRGSVGIFGLWVWRDNLHINHLHYVDRLCVNHFYF